MQIHNHNSEQQQALQQLLNDVIGKLLGVRFENPEHDDRMMRYHAALTGKYELLVQLLQDDYPAPEPIQQPEGA
jgi:hypothetical protein